MNSLKFELAYEDEVGSHNVLSEEQEARAQETRMHTPRPSVSLTCSQTQPKLLLIGLNGPATRLFVSQVVGEDAQVCGHLTMGKKSVELFFNPSTQVVSVCLDEEAYEMNGDVIEQVVEAIGQGIQADITVVLALLDVKNHHVRDPSNASRLRAVKTDKMQLALVSPLETGNIVGGLAGGLLYYLQCHGQEGCVVTSTSEPVLDREGAWSWAALSNEDLGVLNPFVKTKIQASSFVDQALNAFEYQNDPDGMYM